MCRFGFTRIELLVVIAIIVILAAMLLPELASAKKRTKRVAYTNNSKQRMLASLMYASDTPVTSECLELRLLAVRCFSEG